MKSVALLMIFLLTMNFVNAEFSEDNAKNWLNNRITWSQDPIEAISFATIVLESNTGLNQIKNRLNSLTNTKDVALASLALKHMNQDIRNQLNYLGRSLKASTNFDKREWMIQFVVNEDGICDLTYEGGTHRVTFDNEGKIITGGEDSWITFNRMNGFEFDKAIESINIRCDFTSTPRISIIKKTGNSFYIMDEKFSGIAAFEIKNGCYAINPNSNCDKTSTFYVSWVLNRLGEGITTKNYLIDNAETDLDYAILSKIDSSQIPKLISKQRLDGSFNAQVYETSFAFNSIGSSNTYQNQKNSAKGWIETQQNENGMIGTGIKETATALYLVYSISPNIINDRDDEGGGCISDMDCPEDYMCNVPTGICNPLNQEICNANNICDSNLGENKNNCPLECFCGDNVCDSSENADNCFEDCEIDQQPVCGNFRCEAGENNINCASDCFSEGSPNDFGDNEESEERCGDGVCGFSEDEENCSLDCMPEKKSSLWWLWLILIIIILGGGVFFLLNKAKKKPISGLPPYIQRNNSNYPQQQYKQPIRKSQKDSSLESELDKSIKEAQDLLKRK